MVRKTLHCTAIALFILGTSAGAETAFRTFHVGNSLTDEIYGMHGIAEGFGYTDTYWGRLMIPGAPIWWLWQYSGDPNAVKEVKSYDGSSRSFSDARTELSSTSYDVVTLQMYPRNGDGPNILGVGSNDSYGAVGNFVERAYMGNPDCQVYIYPGHWAEGVNHADSLARVFEPVADSVSRRFSDHKPILIIPSVTAFQILYDQGERGLIDGHTTKKGAYVLACVCYATIYRSSPVGAINQDIRWQGGYDADMDPTFAATAQAAAWQAVSTYEHSGVSQSGTVSPSAMRTVTPAQANGRTDMSKSVLINGRSGQLAGRGSATLAPVVNMNGTIEIRQLSR